MKKQKIFTGILVFFMLAGVIFYYYGYYQSSQTVDDFPVPVSATLLKLSKDGSFEEYTWPLASEEDGLPSALGMGKSREDGRHNSF